MKVAITGGSGFVGRRLIAALHRQGHEISVLTRASDKTFPAPVRAVTGDLTAEDCPLAELLVGCDVLFHCAGEVRATEAMRPLHVDGTQRLIEAVSARTLEGRRRLHWVQLSSVGAYGPPRSAASEERVITEDAPTRPVGEYEITKTQADELVMRAGTSGSLSFSILRPSNIFAADMPNASLRALGAMVRKGIFFYIGRPGAIATYVHVDDVVDSLLLCAWDGRAVGKIYNLSNDCLLEEMIGGLAAAMGVTAPRLRLPERVVRTAAVFAQRMVRIPLSQERINALVMRTRYPYSKLEQELGFVPKISVPSAIGEVVSGHQ